jgi:hypothetical protein
MTLPTLQQAFAEWYDHKTVGNRTTHYGGEMAEKIKFKVSIKELSFEYEGTREVGQALQAGLSRSLAGLVDTQRTVMLPAPPVPVHDKINGNGDGPGQIIIDQPAERPRKPRKTSGVSLIGLLRDLKTEKFFGEARSGEAIRERLKAKGHTFTPSTVAARLQDLTKKNELYRRMVGEVWLYKDKPFDEGPRTADAPEQPAE